MTENRPTSHRLLPDKRKKVLPGIFWENPIGKKEAFFRNQTKKETRPGRPEMAAESNFSLSLFHIPDGVEVLLRSVQFSPGEEKGAGEWSSSRRTHFVRAVPMVCGECADVDLPAHGLHPALHFQPPLLAAALVDVDEVVRERAHLRTVVCERVCA